MNLIVRFMNIWMAMISLSDDSKLFPPKAYDMEPISQIMNKLIT